MTESKVEIIVLIAQKGKGVVAEFKRKYTMLELYNGKCRVDGNEYAKNKLNLNISDVAISTAPIDDLNIREEIKRMYDIHDERLAMAGIHNPMQSCFAGYSEELILGKVVYIKTVSGGVVYCIENTSWVDEINN